MSIDLWLDYISINHLEILKIQLNQTLVHQIATYYPNYQSRIHHHAVHLVCCLQMPYLVYHIHLTDQLYSSPRYLPMSIDLWLGYISIDHLTAQNYQLSHTRFHQTTTNYLSYQAMNYSVAVHLVYCLQMEYLVYHILLTDSLN